MRVRKIILIIFLIISFLSIVYGRINFKVSGKVVSNGLGIKGITVFASNQIDKSKDLFETKTDTNGNFYFYLPKGMYEISVSDGNKYIISFENNRGKVITVTNKNVLNIFFFMEKECRISGIARFVDGTPLKGSVDVYNERTGVASGFINSQGKFTVNEILASDNTTVVFDLRGMKSHKINKIFTLKEGEILSNIDLILPQKIISIQGKLLSKEDQKPFQSKRIGVLLNYDKLESDEEYLENYIDTFTDSNGEFIFYNLPVGKHYIYWIVDGFKPGYKSINYNNEIIDLLIELEKE